MQRHALSIALGQEHQRTATAGAHDHARPIHVAGGEHAARKAVFRPASLQSCRHSQAAPRFTPPQAASSVQQDLECSLQRQLSTQAFDFQDEHPQQRELSTSAFVLRFTHSCRCCRDGLWGVAWRQCCIKWVRWVLLLSPRALHAQLPHGPGTTAAAHPAARCARTTQTNLATARIGSRACREHCSRCGHAAAVSCALSS